MFDGKGSVMLAAAFALMGSLAWADWHENNKSHTTEAGQDHEGDIVGFNGFVDYYEFQDEGKDWFGGEYECNNSGHSFGPASPDKWTDDQDNRFYVVWSDDPTSQGETFRSQVYHKSKWFGQSAVAEGATYAAMYINRIKEHTLKVRFLTGPSTWLGVRTNRVFTLNGNQLVLVQSTPRTMVSDLHVIAPAGSFVSAETTFFTLIEYDGNHPPENPSYFEVSPGTKNNLEAEMSLWH